MRRGGNGSYTADFITCSVLNMIGRELIVQHCRHVSNTNHGRGKVKAWGQWCILGVKKYEEVGRDNRGALLKMTGGLEDK